MANEASTISWRSLWRIVAAMAVALGAWLLCTPTAATDGTSCGVPVLNTDADGNGFSSFSSPDCADRNGVRVTQAIWTLVVGGGWLASSAFRAWMADIDADQPASRVAEWHVPFVPSGPWAIRTQCRSLEQSGIVRSTILNERLTGTRSSSVRATTGAAVL